MKPGFSQIRVAVIALKKGSKFLVMKRSKSDPVPDYWEFPGGGAEENEDMEAAAAREIKEETSLKVKSLSLLGRSKVPSHLDPNKILDMYHFLCSDFSGEVVCCAEHSEFKWLPKEEILKLGMITPGTIKHLKLLE